MNPKSGQVSCPHLEADRERERDLDLDLDLDLLGRLGLQSFTCTRTQVHCSITPPLCVFSEVIEGQTGVGAAEPCWCCFCCCRRPPDEVGRGRVHGHGVAPVLEQRVALGVQPLARHAPRPLARRLAARPLPARPHPRHHRRARSAPTPSTSRPARLRLHQDVNARPHLGFHRQASSMSPSATCALCSR